MPASRPLPPIDAAHEQHDELLIAQLAAGDPLAPPERQMAERLIVSCPACAELAADLRTISTAVAREPVPPRRRDFHIDPVRARELRGSRWTRFLRRLSVPQAGALRPAAAGVMSLGLILVVAGSVWPAAETTSTPVPAAVPQASLSAEAVQPLVERAPIDDTGGSSVPMSDALGVDAPPAAGESMAAGAPAAEAPAADGEDAHTKAATTPARDVDASYQERADTLADEGDTGGADDRSRLGLEATPAAASEAGLAMEAAPPSAQPDAEPSTPSPAEPAASVMAADGAAVTSGAAQQELVADSAAGMGAAADTEATTAAANAAAGTEATAATANAEGGGMLDVETLVVWVGLLLILGGALVLLIVWLSRRAADPLLR
jgi:hypothetical protein